MAGMDTRGKRLAQARRLWAAALGQDVSQVDAGAMVGVSGATWSRWETDTDNPRRGALEKIAEKSAALGLPQITAGWIDYNEGEGPPQIGNPTVVSKPARHIKKHGKIVKPGDAKPQHRRKA